MTAVTSLARMGRELADLFNRGSVLRVAAPVVLLGGMALPSLAATYYYIFDIHPSSDSQTYFSGVASFTTTDTTLVAGATYYFNQLQGYQGTLTTSATPTYTPTSIGIGTTANQAFGTTPTGTNNALSQTQAGATQVVTPGSGQGGVVANALGSIYCTTSTLCYLKDAAFGYTLNGTNYYWVEGIRGNDTAATLDIHNTNSTYTTPIVSPVAANNTKVDCGSNLTTITGTSCAALTSDPLPEINGAALPKAALVLLSLFLFYRHRASARDGAHNLPL